MQSTKIGIFFCGYFLLIFKFHKFLIWNQLYLYVSMTKDVWILSRQSFEALEEDVFEKKCIYAYEALEISFDVVALFQKFYCSTYLSILHQIKFSQENLYHCSRFFFFTLLPEFDGKYFSYLKIWKFRSWRKFTFARPQ